MGWSSSQRQTPSKLTGCGVLAAARARSGVAAWCGFGWCRRVRYSSLGSNVVSGGQQESRVAANCLDRWKMYSGTQFPCDLGRDAALSAKT